MNKLERSSDGDDEAKHTKSYLSHTARGASFWINQEAILMAADSINVVSARTRGWMHRPAECYGCARSLHQLPRTLGIIYRKLKLISRRRQWRTHSTTCRVKITQTLDTRQLACEHVVLDNMCTQRRRRCIYIYIYIDWNANLSHLR